MDYTTYKIIHLIGVAALAMGIGGMLAGGNTRKGSPSSREWHCS
jgi:hypothetical protein